MSKSKSGLRLALSVLVGIAAVGVIACFAFVEIFSDDIELSTDEQPAEEPVVVIPPKAVEANTRILMAGTTFWGRRTNKVARNSELGFAYPFSELDTLDRGRYNAWIAGIECPVTDNPTTDYEEETLLIFNCDTEYLEEASKYISVAMLGNNHTDAREMEGFIETKKNLKEFGIQSFGSYDYADGETNCSAITLPVNVKLDNGESVEYKIPFGFCSAHGVFGIPTEAVRANIERYAKFLPTIAMPHMGAEYEPSADQLRTNLYREMIDRGADAVIADHPHWIQNSEAYNDHLIAYSMGNFMFDQEGKEYTRSAAIEAFAQIDMSDTDLDTWNKLGVYCEEHDGDCIEKIEAANLPKLKINWTYDYHGTSTEGTKKYVTHLASDYEQAEIGQRLRWDAIPDYMKIK